jgi:two-component system response regulator YesN
MNAMVAREDASRRVFLRYALTNLLILALPLLAAALSFRISVGVIQRDIDAITVAQLERSMSGIEQILADLQKMSIQVSDNFQVRYYLANPGPFTGIEFYNLKEISEKLSSYVLSNTLLSHCFLSLEKSGTLVYESGFAAYAGFYGTLFSVDGFTAVKWHDEFLRAAGAELFLPRQTVRMGGQPSVSHLYRRSIGYGDYYLGSIVGVIDGPGLDRLLADLPRTYGGWAFVQDSQGRLIGSTNPDLDKVTAVRDRAASADRISWEGETYRLYRRTSTVNGWQYTAVLSESRVLAGVRTVIRVALALLGIAAAAGLAASWVFAFSNTRPLARLFALVLGDQAAGRGRLASVYEQVEQAFVTLSDSNRRLAREVEGAAKIGAAWFYQNLLRGTYRSRELFAKERRLFRAEFPPGACHVVLCRLAALSAAREGRSYPLLREALLAAVARHLGEGEVVVPVSFDDVAVIRGQLPASGPTGADHRTAAAAFVEAVRASLDTGIRGDFFFGIGRPTDDPFLLSLSHQEAATAVTALAAEGRGAFSFYEDLPRDTASYHYPLDLEESVVRAVRSANADLLDSLLDAIRRENLAVRHLSAIELRNLLIELSGTVRRLANEVPQESRTVRAELEGMSTEEPAAQGFEAVSRLLHALLDVHRRGKRSHNTRLLASIQEYIARSFSRPDLGLTVLADAFGISENYLSSFYKEQTGEGLSAAIHHIRFEEAERLLAETDDTIDEIARACGYLNTGSFRRAFKQRYGVSPSQHKANRAGTDAGRAAG